MYPSTHTCPTPGVAGSATPTLKRPACNCPPASGTTAAPTSVWLIADGVRYDPTGVYPNFTFAVTGGGFGGLATGARLVEAGIGVCVAAGNMGPAGHTIGAPSAARRGITVGASGATAVDTTDPVAGFSSRGPTCDGSAKAYLIFPGLGVARPHAARTGLDISRAALASARPHA